LHCNDAHVPNQTQNNKIKTQNLTFITPLKRAKLAIHPKYNKIKTTQNLTSMVMVMVRAPVTPLKTQVAPSWCPCSRPDSK
jgi:hypothetical protein